MIAYNRLWLKNLFILQQAETAFFENCLDKNELDQIVKKYPVLFYSTNFFIRIGLFILTTLIVLFSFGLFILLFPDSIDHAMGGMAIFFSILAYSALEYMVHSKKHFQSGVDDALLWISAGSFFVGINTITNAGELANCFILFIIAFYCAIRFADRLMCVVLYLSLLGIFFFIFTGLGPLAKAIVPFVLMAISAILYMIVKTIKRFSSNQLYSNCLKVISVASLMGLYLSGNYFVVREFSNFYFDLNLSEGKPIPLAWIFWCFTLLMPCLYILRGLQKKDASLIRVGLFFSAVIVFTVRYYYALASIEVIMTIGGIVLVVLSYLLTRYLTTPKYGFTNIEIISVDTKTNLQLESLVQVQTFSGHAASSDATKFGGGGFGGGGGSGDF